MKDINLKDNDVSVPETVVSDDEGYVCSPEFGCKNCFDDEPSGGDVEDPK